MKKKLRYFLAAGAMTALLGTSLVYTSSAASVQPGSTADPLVSKSYVDEQIVQLLKLINQSSTGTSATIPNPAPTPTPAPAIVYETVDTNAIVSSVMTQMELMYGDTLLSEESANAYVPVSAAKGKIIIGHEGTEIILRSGKAVGFCTGENGLVDITDGTEVFNKTAIKINHLLIVPRLDGRGVQVTEDAWFIIKGGYDVQ